MDHVHSHRGVEGLPLFEHRPIQRFAPIADVHADLGYSPCPRRKGRDEFLSADDARDEQLDCKLQFGQQEDFIFGLPENQRSATAEELKDFFDSLKELLADSTSHPR
jgi:hypothetical protein